MYHPSYMQGIQDPPRLSTGTTSPVSAGNCPACATVQAHPQAATVCCSCMLQLQVEDGGERGPPGTAASRRHLAFGAGAQEPPDPGAPSRLLVPEKTGSPLSRWPWRRAGRVPVVTCPAREFVPAGTDLAARACRSAAPVSPSAAQPAAHAASMEEARGWAPPPLGLLLSVTHWST